MSTYLVQKRLVFDAETWIALAGEVVIDPPDADILMRRGYLVPVPDNFKGVVSKPHKATSRAGFKGVVSKPHKATSRAGSETEESEETSSSSDSAADNSISSELQEEEDSESEDEEDSELEEEESESEATPTRQPTAARHKVTPKAVTRQR
jgi:hypothetical protein